MAELLRLTLKKFEAAFQFPPYNYMLQTAPVEEHYKNNKYYHWYLRLVPHLVTLGGFELSSGCYINPVSPEKAAEFLRNVSV
jgi:UDPglucose--hexose-1-phosphate uridylyltransferase